MKTLLALCFTVLAFTGLQAQNTLDTSKVFSIVQQRPIFPGDINTWLGNNIVYPIDAKRNNIAGTVYISFIVERSGMVTHTKVLRSANASLDNEAVRVVSMMPKWTPGMQNGTPVRVQYNLPIHFQLAGSDTSHNVSSDNNKDKVYTIVQSKPVFSGDINKYLSDHINYPDDARKNNIQGTVYVKFIVEMNGSVSNVEVMRGVQGGRSLENEAVRVVSGMPAWTPGMQNGHPVRVQYLIPIHFVLNNVNTTPNNSRNNGVDNSQN